MNQDFLDEHIGTPPPSRIDVDQLIARQRRRGRLRWTGTAGAAAVAVLAVAIGTHLVGAGPRTAPVAGPGHSASPSPSPTGLRLEVGDASAVRRTQEKLRVALEAAVASAAPDVSWIYMPDVPGERRLPDGHPAMSATKKPVRFTARSGIAAGGIKAGFYMWVSPAAACEPSTPCHLLYPVHKCDGSQPVCATATTPAGLEIVSWTEKSPARGGKQYVFYGVQVKLRPDYYLQLDAVNYFGGDGSAVSAKTPILTAAQLETIAGEIADQIEG